MNQRFLILCTSILLLFSCSSPQKLYEKGKYFKAFDAALNDVKSKKKDRKNLVLLNKAFSKMIDEAVGKMYYLEDGYEVKDLRYNLEQYEEVDKRYVKGRSYLDDDNIIKYKEFETDKFQLVDDAYLEGKALLVFYEESKNKIDAQNAYLHFELVYNYGSGYSDLDQLLSESKIAGTIVYLVDADLDSDFSYQWEVDRKFDNLEGQDGFVKILYDNRDQTGDCVVELDFARLDVDENDSEFVQNYSKEIIDSYTTEVDTSGKTIKTPVYKEVSGSVRTVTITKRVSWRIDLEILKSNINCNLNQDRFSASVVDKVETYDIRGDERAIPQEFLNNTNQEIEDTDDMVDELLDQLYDKIRNYFY